MSKSTPPSISPSRNFQNIKKVDDSNDYTERFGEEGDGNVKFSDLVEETIDSGFISGPQTTSSANLATDNEEYDIPICDMKKLNIKDPSSESQQHKKSHLDLDSGIIEEEYDDSECDLKQHQQSNQQKMVLTDNVDSGTTEWFWNFNLENNPNSSNLQLNPSKTGINNLDPSTIPQFSNTHSNVQRSTTAIPQQITPANAWQKYYQQDSNGDTALHYACLYGLEDVVAALIRMAPHPCLFNIKNDDGHTPLHVATLTAEPKLIRMLLIAGAEPIAFDCNGNTALHIACRSGKEQCVRALTIPISASEVNEAHRQYGHRSNDKSYLKYAKLPSDLEIVNFNGERCVHLAAKAGFINILRILVLYGADINAREGTAGNTPLHIAIKSCNEELANYLLDECQKLNTEIPTYGGLTAYQTACVNNRSEIIRILEKKGAIPLSPPESDCCDCSDSDSESDLSDTMVRY